MNTRSKKPKTRTPKAPKSKEQKGPRAREGSKQSQLIAMLSHPKGATIDEIVEALSWQPHYADARIMPTCVGNPALRAVIAAMDAA